MVSSPLSQKKSNFPIPVVNWEGLDLQSGKNWYNRVSTFFAQESSFSAEGKIFAFNVYGTEGAAATTTKGIAEMLIN